jgi:uncharacterized RDD family membrane protein YckC
MPSATSLKKSTASLPAAGVARRLAALVYDAFLLFGLLVVPLLIATAVLHGGPKPLAMANETVAHDLPSIAPKLLLQIYWLVVVGGFYCYFWRKNGQTLGMQAWRLRVDANAGGRPTWKQCGLRLLTGAASLLLAGLGFWWIWLDPQRRSWHDRASDTRVVVLPKQGKIENYA